jgi:hypothetical protein
MRIIYYTKYLYYFAGAKVESSYSIENTTKRVFLGVSRGGMRQFKD